jgi:hypothetical protein
VKTIFHIDQDTGAIHLGDRICRSGFVTVTHNQAEVAHQYNWHKFGLVLGKPDLVVISRPMLGCHID